MEPITEYDLTEPPLSYPELDVPKDLRLTLLPPSTGSVKALLQFKNLPQAVSPIEDDQKRTSAWFSSDSPESDFDAVVQLPRWPLPPAVFIRSLVDVLRSGCSFRGGSVKPGHLSEGLQSRRLPLWVLTYWIEASEAQSAQTAWKRATRWMDTHSRGFPKGTALKQDIMELLRTVRWNETLHGPGMSGTPLQSLTKYLSFEWLAGHHVADQILAMYDELSASSWDSESPHLLVDLEFSNRVLEAYKDQAQYATAPDFAFLRSTLR